MSALIVAGAALAAFLVYVMVGATLGTIAMAAALRLYRQPLDPIGRIAAVTVLLSEFEPVDMLLGIALWPLWVLAFAVAFIGYHARRRIVNFVGGEPTRAVHLVVVMATPTGAYGSIDSHPVLGPLSSERVPEILRQMALRIEMRGYDADETDVEVDRRLATGLPLT